MMSLLIRFILSLCFLSLGGYAYTHQFHIGYTSRNIFQTSAQKDFSSILNDKIVITKAPSSNTRKLNDKIKAVEIEDDDESTPIRKYSEAGNYCINFYYDKAPQFVCHNYNNRLPFCEHFSSPSCDKFIINRVIRI